MYWSDAFISGLFQQESLANAKVSMQQPWYNETTP